MFSRLLLRNAALDGLVVPAVVAGALAVVARILHAGVGSPAVRVGLARVDACHLGLGRAELVAELTDAHRGLTGRVLLARVEQHANAAPVADLVGLAIRVRLARLATLDRRVGAEAPVAGVGRAALVVVAVLGGLALGFAGPDLRRGRLRRCLLGLLAEVGEEGLDFLVGEGERAPLHRELGGQAAVAVHARFAVRAAGGAPGTHGPHAVSRRSTIVLPGLAGNRVGAVVRLAGLTRARLAADEGGEDEEGDGEFVAALHEFLLRVRAAACGPRDGGHGGQ